MLVAAVDMETGADIALSDLASHDFDWPGPMAKVHRLSFADAVSATKQGGRGQESEGFVVCFALAAQQAAANNGISPHPLYKLRTGRSTDALAQIWSDLRSTADSDPIQESLSGADAE